MVPGFHTKDSNFPIDVLYFQLLFRFGGILTSKSGIFGSIPQAGFRVVKTIRSENSGVIPRWVLRDNFVSKLKVLGKHFF